MVHDRSPACFRRMFIIPAQRRISRPIVATRCFIIQDTTRIINKGSNGSGRFVTESVDQRICKQGTLIRIPVFSIVGDEGGLFRRRTIRRRSLMESHVRVLPPTPCLPLEGREVVPLNLLRIRSIRDSIILLTAGKRWAIIVRVGGKGWFVADVLPRAISGRNQENAR